MNIELRKTGMNNFLKSSATAFMDFLWIFYGYFMDITYALK